MASIQSHFKMTGGIRGGYKEKDTFVPKYKIPAKKDLLHSYSGSVTEVVVTVVNFFDSHDSCIYPTSKVSIKFIKILINFSLDLVFDSYVVPLFKKTLKKVLIRL